MRAVVPVDLIGCNCENTRFDVDEFGRVWYPDLLRAKIVYAAEETCDVR